MTLDPHPWKCNACDTRQDKDTTLWWLVIPVFRHGEVVPAAVQAMPWDEALARELKEAAHCCGIPCALKVAAQQMDLMRRRLIRPANDKF